METGNIIFIVVLSIIGLLIIVGLLIALFRYKRIKTRISESFPSFRGRSYSTILPTRYSPSLRRTKTLSDLNDFLFGKNIISSYDNY